MASNLAELIAPGKLKAPPPDLVVNAEAPKKTPPPKKNAKMAKRTTVGADAYCVDAKFRTVEVVEFVDTGAMVTTLSAEVLDRSPELTKMLRPCILSHVIGMGVSIGKCIRRNLHYDG